MGAILFYTDAMHHIKSCTEVLCAWSMPSSVDSIPYVRITDMDFVKLKSIIKPV